MTFFIEGRMKHKSFIPFSIVIVCGILFLSEPTGHWKNRLLSLKLHGSSLLFSKSLSPVIVETSPSPFFPEITRASKCVFYDRPPRTGSSTISNALHDCMIQKDFSSVGGHSKSGRNYVMSEMLNFSTDFRASVRGHIVLSYNDTLKLKKYCDEYLYISSISPIIKRVVSQVKYSMFHGHHNQTINIVSLVNRMKVRDTVIIQGQEAFLESYPYDVNDTIISEENRLQPHYIIRRDQLVDDLTALMGAMNCEGISLQSRNVHPIISDNVNKTETEDFNTSEIMEELRQVVTSKIQGGNHRYLKLSEMARRRNKDGLLRAQKMFS